jgi:hypothetical protein
MKLIFIRKNNNNNIHELCYILKHSTYLKIKNKNPKSSKLGSKNMLNEGPKHQNSPIS